MGIVYGSLDASLQARVLPATPVGLKNQVVRSPGANAQGVLYVPANLVNGDTIVFNGQTFEVDIINTDSGVNTVDSALGAVHATADPVLITTSAAPATAIAAGDLLKIESEIFKVLRKISTTEYVCARARCGTAKAAHLQNLDIIVSDAAPAANVPVGLVTTLTPAVFGPAFIQEFNNAVAGIERATAKASTQYSDYIAHTLVGLDAGQQIVITARAAGVDEAATTEEFTNSTDNVWGAATLTGGQDPAVRSFETVTRVPTAAEELLGEMHFAFPFTVAHVVVEMVITATGQRVFFSGEVRKGYVESTDATLPATVVTLRNVGAASTAYITGFAATNSVTVWASE